MKGNALTIRWLNAPALNVFPGFDAKKIIETQFAGKKIVFWGCKQID